MDDVFKEVRNKSRKHTDMVWKVSSNFPVSKRENPSWGNLPMTVVGEG